MTGYYIASVSWGKDSLFMLLSLIERGDPLNEVAFYDTGMEFQAIYDTRDAVLPLLASRGIVYTELTPPRPFVYDMFEKPIYSKQNGQHCGYSWCGGPARWGTASKTAALDSNAKKHTGQTVIQYVGIAADETQRIEKERKASKRLPLVEWGLSEQQCLEGCYASGFEWREDGGAGVVRLYDVLDRVSCWCCKNKNLKELKNIYLRLPRYWNRLKELQARTERPMKGEGKSVFELERRFEAEEAAKAAQIKLFTEGVKA